MKKKLLALLALTIIAVGLTVAPAAADTCAIGGAPTASWGCGKAVNLNFSNGTGYIYIDDFYVSAFPGVSQSSVNACTYAYVVKSNGAIQTFANDCGGLITAQTFNVGGTVDVVCLQSKDNRARWRWMTLATRSGATHGCGG